MSEAVAQVLTRINAMSEEERAEVAVAVLRTLVPRGTEEGAEEAWERELSRRVAEIKAGTAKGKPAEQLFAELRARRA